MNRFTMPLRLKREDFTYVSFNKTTGKHIKRSVKIQDPKEKLNALNILDNFQYKTNTAGDSDQRR